MMKSWFLLQFQIRFDSQVFCLAIIYLEERSQFKAKLSFWGFILLGYVHITYIFQMKS